ncbi:MAG: hypothetical protein AB4042_20320, partial [Leptolyngbyaceae cyanobacterium]
YFKSVLTQKQQEMLVLKQQNWQDRAIAQEIGCTITQMHKQWSKLLEKAWDIRNNLVSGTNIEGNE